MAMEFRRSLTADTIKIKYTYYTYNINTEKQKVCIKWTDWKSSTDCGSAVRGRY